MECRVWSIPCGASVTCGLPRIMVEETKGREIVLPPSQPSPASGGRSQKQASTVRSSDASSSSLTHNSQRSTLNRYRRVLAANGQRSAPNT